MKAKLKLFKGVTSVYVGEHGLDEGAESLVEFIQGMGYFVYADPCGESGAYISDRSLTYGDLKKHAKQLDIDLEWWDNVTDFNERLDEELETIL